MPETTPQPPPHPPWENGWVPDTSRTPGTRRLWLAGTLAIATIVACVTAIAVSRTTPDQASTPPAPEANTDHGPGLLSFASPTPTSSASPAKDKSGMSWTSPSASGKAAATEPGGTSKSGPSKGSSGKASAKPTKTPSAPKPPSSYQRSVQAVNYPDRYWHVSDGLVKLDPPGGSESRADSTLTVVKGLADSSCYTFKTSDGRYLRHRDFILRAEGDDGSTLFKQDATFCATPSPYSDAVMLESVNYPNYCLRHKNFQLRLDPYGYNTANRADFSFRIVSPLG